jgi:hypothetical protein
MNPETLRIDELVLRLPSVEEARARLIAKDVAERVASAVGRTEMYTIPAGAALSVYIPAGTPTEDLAETIARRILEALR